eukprot:1156318-Pelagomonas_calceolata.AAC.7
MGGEESQPFPNYPSYPPPGHKDLTIPRDKVPEWYNFTLSDSRNFLTTSNATDLEWLYSNLRLLKRTQDLEQEGQEEGPSSGKDWFTGEEDDVG